MSMVMFVGVHRLHGPHGPPHDAQLSSGDVAYLDPRRGDERMAVAVYLSLKTKISIRIEMTESYCGCIFPDGIALSSRLRERPPGGISSSRDSNVFFAFVTENTNSSCNKPDRLRLLVPPMQLTGDQWQFHSRNAPLRRERRANRGTAASSPRR